MDEGGPRQNAAWRTEGHTSLLILPIPKCVSVACIPLQIWETHFPPCSCGMGYQQPSSFCASKEMQSLWVPFPAFCCLSASRSDSFLHALIRFFLSVLLTQFRLFEGTAELPGGCGSALGGRGWAAELSRRNGSGSPQPGGGGCFWSCGSPWFAPLGTSGCMFFSLNCCIWCAVFCLVVGVFLFLLKIFLFFKGGFISRLLEQSAVGFQTCVLTLRALIAPDITWSQTWARQIIHPPPLLCPLSCPLYVGHPVSQAASPVWIPWGAWGEPSLPPLFILGSQFRVQVLNLWLFSLCVGGDADFPLTAQDDCSSAVIITCARLRSDGRGEDLCGGMTQGWCGASLGPDLVFAGCRNFSPKSWSLGQEWFTTRLPVSILSAWHWPHLLLQRPTEKVWDHLFSWFLLVFAGFLPGWRISGGVGGK